MARVLVAARRVAGPAIRAAHIARVLGKGHEVRLASLAGESTSPIDGRTVFDLAETAVDEFDAAVVQGSVLVRLPELAECRGAASGRQ